MSLTHGGPVSVGDTSTPIVAANAKRRELVVCNNDESNAIWIGINTAAVVGKGIRIPKEGSLPLDTREDPDYTAAVNGICDTGKTANASYLEKSA